MVDVWGKRKKYTPIFAALRFLTEKYPAPIFSICPERFANLFASYAVFEDWIRKILLFVVPCSLLNLISG